MIKESADMRIRTVKTRKGIFVYLEDVIDLVRYLNPEDADYNELTIRRLATKK